MRKKYPLATEEQAQEILKLVDGWLNEVGPIFNNCRNTSRSTVAEYLANTFNLTLYESRAE